MYTLLYEQGCRLCGAYRKHNVKEWQADRHVHVCVWLSCAFHTEVAGALQKTMPHFRKRVPGYERPQK